MIKMVFNGWKRVSKKTAEKLHDQGKEIVLIPHKLQPFTPWHCEFYVSQKDERFTDCYGKLISFRNIVQQHEWYNCNCYETGYYSAFYVREGDEK